MDNLTYNDGQTFTEQISCQALETIIAQANAQSFSNILDLYTFLINK